jgi:DNA helicase-2/ATP-dependent DNA helicase PcrA
VRPVSVHPFPGRGLNDEQRRVVEHGFESGDPAVAAAVARGDVAPLLVVAGAGSGKTTTLAARVARLVTAGASPERILLLTFSRRAAAELDRRVGRALHAALGLPPTARPPSLPWCGTFHSVGARLLRDLGPAIGLDPAFTVDDRGDAEDALHVVRQRLGLAAATGSRFPQKGTCLAILSRCVNAREPLAQVVDERFPWVRPHTAELGRLFAAYTEAKLAERVLDLDDLLAWWAEAMADDAVAASVAARFDHVLVDEYQDTNRLQAAIVRRLRPGGRGLAVVGDDAQSIYSFRAAEVRNILDFAADAGPGTAVRTLVRNHRSTVPILDASNGVIALAREGYAKRLDGDRGRGDPRPGLVRAAGVAEQAEWVATHVLALRESGLRLRDQAVLFRTASHANALEIELTRRGIPFVKFGGLAFLETSHVKDVLAVLRLAQNPRGTRAGMRALQLVRGMGPAAAAKLVAALGEAASPLDAVRAFQPPPAARAAWAEFAPLLDALGRDALGWPDALGRVVDWYGPVLDRLHPSDAGPRAADLTQLAAIARGFPSRARFLAELALDPPGATSDHAGPPSRDEDWLTLSTIHSAKGQEWSAVTVLSVVDGCIPSDMATGSEAEIEEERRLLYVAMTRARDHLHLVVPQRFHVDRQPRFGDRHVWGGQSRFVPPELVQRCFEEIVPGFEIATDEAPVGCEAPPETKRPAGDVHPGPVDVAARLRGRWM